MRRTRFGSNRALHSGMAVAPSNGSASPTRVMDDSNVSVFSVHGAVCVSRSLERFSEVVPVWHSRGMATRHPADLRPSTSGGR